MEFGEPPLKCAFCKNQCLAVWKSFFGETETLRRSKVWFCYRGLEPGTLCNAPIWSPYLSAGFWLLKLPLTGTLTHRTLRGAALSFLGHLTHSHTLLREPVSVYGKDIFGALLFPPLELRITFRKKAAAYRFMEAWPQKQFALLFQLAWCSLTGGTLSALGKGGCGEEKDIHEPGTPPKLPNLPVDSHQSLSERLV